MDIRVDESLAYQLLISFFIGTMIGLEREYRSKAAGLRTMIMICLGSTIFTQLSLIISANSPDRIASTIVTGIGFLGAGVIFKDGLTITGITTATTIWISAALGMAVGMGQYFIAINSCGVVLIVLSVFEKLQHYIERVHQTRVYKIQYDKINIRQDQFGEIPKKLNLEVKKRREHKLKDCVLLVYQISGNEKNLEAFNDYLRNEEEAIAFEY